MSETEGVVVLVAVARAGLAGRARPGRAREGARLLPVHAGTTAKRA